MKSNFFIFCLFVILICYACNKKPVDTPAATHDTTTVNPPVDTTKKTPIDTIPPVIDTLKIFLQNTTWNFIRIDELNVPIQRYYQRSNGSFTDYSWTNNKIPDTLFFYPISITPNYVVSYIFRDTTYEKFTFLNQDTVSSILIINNFTRNTIDTEYVSLTSQSFSFSPSKYGHYGLISFNYKLPLQLNNVPPNQCPSCPGVMGNSSFYQKTDTSYSFSNTIYFADIFIGSSSSSSSANHMVGGGNNNSIFISKQNGLLKNVTGTFDYMANYGTQSITTTRFRLN